MNESKKKVLIVDDDKLLAQSLEQLFLDSGYDVAVMYTGEDAEKKIIEYEPDVILLDIMLPVMTGVEIVTRLTKDKPETLGKIVVMTTLNDSGSLAKVLELGITHYVQKNTATPQQVFDTALRIIK